MIDITPNANFHSIGGTSVHSSESLEYREYRRCWDDYPKKFILRDFPLHLDIEATSRCNLKCTFCDRQPLLRDGQLGDMTFGLFRKIIDEGRDHKLWSIKLSYRGEPLLNENIVEMVKYAKENGVLDVYFNTNGMLLTEELTERLIDAGLNRISFSVEGTDSVTYNAMRINADFDKVVGIIERVRKLREKKGTPYPQVRVQSVNYPGFSIDEYRKFWVSRCDEVAMLDFTDVSKRETGLLAKWACPQLWQRMTIEWDGTVFPCNNDDLRLMSPGNVSTRSIHECWHDEKLQTVRERHACGKSHEPKACDGCSWRTAQIAPQTETTP